MLNEEILILGKDKPYEGLEDDLQRSCAKDLKHIGHNFFWCHIPNEEKRSGKRTSSQKGKGLVNGAPDLVILLPKGGYHGLVIELKIWPRKPEHDQIFVLNKCVKQGYLTTVVYNYPSFQKLIRSYINGVYTKNEA